MCWSCLVAGSAMTCAHGPCSLNCWVSGVGFCFKTAGAWRLSNRCCWRQSREPIVARGIGLEVERGADAKAVENGTVRVLLCLKYHKPECVELLDTWCLRSYITKRRLRGDCVD